VYNRFSFFLAALAGLQKEKWTKKNSPVLLARHLQQSASAYKSLYN
jgi:hypothetical protein